jgi:hypothetical protein
MRIWKDTYGRIGVESQNHAETAALAKFIEQNKIKFGVYDILSHGLPSSTQPCPDCGWDGRHHS